MAGKGGRYTTNSLDKGTLAISAVAGIAGSFLSGLIYNIISYGLWSPLAVGISFMVFTAVFVIIMVVVNLVNGNLSHHLSQCHDGGQIALALIGIIIGALILGTIFEFLYELNFFPRKKAYQEPTSYVFLIDNSGSMEQSDPEGLRYEAIKEIISGKEESFPYAVYGFSNDVEMMRELAPVSAGNNDLSVGESNGGTSIRGTLDHMYDEYTNGLDTQMGSAPKFLLLSDGYATDISFFSSINKTLKNYAKTDIEISTVGLGEADDQLMQQIADDTGGVYISVENVSQLEQSMSQAISKSGTNKYTRTLYTLRNVPSMNIIYAIMRILFTSILGIVISISMLFATGRNDSSERIIITSLITGGLAGLVLELLINGIPLPPNIVRYMYFILVALTFITEIAYGGGGRGKNYTDEEDVFETTRLKMGSKRSLKSGGNSSSASGVNDSMTGASSGDSSFDEDDFFNDF